MLRRLALRDFVLVHRLELDLGRGFTVLTGETGAGKSILVDALQLVLGARADALSVREGAARAEVSAEFDSPASLAAWLDEAGFEAVEGTLLLRRTVDEQGRSRAWINGSSATVAQLREAAEHLVEIHGQHAWQSLTRPAAVRALLDEQAGLDTREMEADWRAWRQAQQTLEQARAQAEVLSRERERLLWQLAELDKLDPGEHEWDTLQAEHQRLAHAQSLLESARQALEVLVDGEPSVDTLLDRAASTLADAGRLDPALGMLAQVLRDAQSPLQDAARTLQAYLNDTEPDPARLAQLDARLSAWIALARRHRCPPAELPHRRVAWRAELQALEAAGDLPALERAERAAQATWHEAARAVSAGRHRQAPLLSSAVTQAMQSLGMAGGRFEVALPACDTPQAHGLESVEFLVAGHAGSSPRALAKVASGGELSRLALAIAATTASERAQGPRTLVFDEIDAGVGGAVADSVGRLMKQLGTNSQVLAVTHLAQVAACADAHVVVAKSLQGGAAATQVQFVTGEARVAEVARMLGGERFSGLAHAQAMLGSARA
jgi:DNA repair protein RecN (Recombination protein N)